MAQLNAILVRGAEVCVLSKIFEHRLVDIGDQSACNGDADQQAGDAFCCGTQIMFDFGAVHDIGKSSSPSAIGTAAIVLEHQRSMASNQDTVNVRVGKAVKPPNKSA